jgi:ketosteroid isomerase-like protein
MSTETNKQSARRFAEQVSSGKVDPALLADDFIHWSAMGGELTADGLAAAMVHVVAVFVEPFKIHIDRVIAEDNIVAMEAHSVGELKSGARYRNKYHFMFEFAPDGRIRRINEHMDSKHAHDVMTTAVPSAAS